MSICNYIVIGKNCGIEIEEPGQEMCYVHSCIAQNKPIKNWHKFKRFIDKHGDIFFLPEDNPESMIFDFQLNYHQFYGAVDKIGYERDLTLKNIIFKKEAIFDEELLMPGLDIVKCTFEKKAYFNNIIFSGTGRDTRSVLSHHIEMVDFNEGADFSKAQLNNVEFKDVDFSKCLFKGAVFNNCKFTNVQWAIKSSWLPFIGKINKRKAVLFDELNLKRKDSEYLEKLSDLERIYRSLKALSKSAEDRDMEGEYNYSENEMIRKRSKRYKQPFTSKFWYFLVSRYGERPSWAFINTFFIIFIWSFLYLFSGVTIINSSEIVNFNTINFSNWPYLLAHSFSPITLNKWQITTTPNLYTYFLSIFEGGFLATQIGLFVMAFRRKFQR